MDSADVPDRTQALAEAAADLARLVESLQHQVVTLSDGVQASNRDVEENTAYLKRKIAALDRADVRRGRMIRALWGTIAGAVCVAVLGVILLHGQYVTRQQQERTRTQVLCPLYTVYLEAIAAQPDPPPGTPAQQRVYEDAVAAIRGGYAKLGCPKITASSPTGAAVTH